MNLAEWIDHTVLRPEAGLDDVRRAAAEAREHGFAALCVHGCYAEAAAVLMRGSDIPVCAVVGFPLGAMKATVKSIEAVAAVKDGAAEIDLVAHLPHLLGRDLPAARNEVVQMVRAARAVSPAVIVKLIIESAMLMQNVSADEAEARIATACQVAQQTGCDFVKTSTGFHPTGGATVEAVRLMKKHAGDLRVKASGGIGNRAQALALLDAGADRLGCSRSVQIVEESR